MLLAFAPALIAHRVGISGDTTVDSGVQAGRGQDAVALSNCSGCLGAPRRDSAGGDLPCRGPRDSAKSGRGIHLKWHDLPPPGSQSAATLLPVPLPPNAAAVVGAAGISGVAESRYESIGERDIPEL